MKNENRVAELGERGDQRPHPTMCDEIVPKIAVYMYVVPVLVMLQRSGPMLHVTGLRDRGAVAPITHTLTCNGIKTITRRYSVCGINYGTLYAQRTLPSEVPFDSP